MRCLAAYQIRVAEEFRIKIVIKLAVTILVLLNSCSWNLQFLEYPTLLDTQNQPVEHLNAVFQGRDTCMPVCVKGLKQNREKH